MPANIRTTKLGNADQTGLDYNKIWDALRKLAQENVREKFSVSITPVTDSTGGTVNPYTIVPITRPAAFLTDGVASTGVQKTGFDTSMGKFANAAASFANFLNPYIAQIGNDPITIAATGVTITAAVAALDTSTTGVATTGAVDYTTGIAEINKQLNNFSTLAAACNKIAAALGIPYIVDASTGLGVTNTPSVSIATATAASVTGNVASTLAKSVVDTLFVNLGNNYATLIDFANRALTPGVGALTDSTGGTASAALPPVEALVTLPTAFTTAGTDCAPKAGFDTLLGVYRNAVASLADSMNRHINFIGNNAPITKLGYSAVAGTVSTTLAAETNALVAVTGTTVCVNATTGIAALTLMDANISTLVAKVNEISYFHGLLPIVDNSGGVASTTNTLVAMPTTSAGNDGTASQTLSNAVVNTALGVIRNNVATLAARMNALTELDSRPQASVVAVQ